MGFRRAKGILGTILAEFGFFGLVLYFILDFRCAEGMLGTILAEIVFFGLLLFFVGDVSVLKVYLVVLPAIFLPIPGDFGNNGESTITKLPTRKKQ